MSNLVSLALAAEARGKAHQLLDKAQAQTALLRAEIEADALELTQAALRDEAAKTKPGEQLRLPTHASSYSTRYVQAERRESLWPRRRT